MILDWFCCKLAGSALASVRRADLARLGRTFGHFDGRVQNQKPGRRLSSKRAHTRSQLEPVLGPNQKSGARLCPDSRLVGRSGGFCKREKETFWLTTARREPSRWGRSLASLRVPERLWASGSESSGSGPSGSGAG